MIEIVRKVLTSKVAHSNLCGRSNGCLIELVCDKEAILIDELDFDDWKYDSQMSMKSF